MHRIINQAIDTKIKSKNDSKTIKLLQIKMKISCRIVHRSMANKINLKMRQQFKRLQPKCHIAKWEQVTLATNLLIRKNKEMKFSNCDNPNNSQIYLMKEWIHLRSPSLERVRMIQNPTDALIPRWEQPLKPTVPKWD